MTYRELIELYKAGELELEQQKKIEQDIERQEAIGDYLYEKEEIPELGDVFTEKDDTDFVKVVNRSIRSAFRKLGLAVLAVTLVLVLFIQFCLPSVVSRFYYNPAKEAKAGQSTQTQFSRDMAAYTELFLPGKRRVSATVESKGYGDYNFTIPQTFSMTGTMTDVSGYITRGKIHYYDSNILKTPVGNSFFWNQADAKSKTSSASENVAYMEKVADLKEGESISTSAGGNKEDSKAYIKDLDSRKMYLAYVSLENIMDYPSFAKYIQKQKINEVWCGVQTNAFDSLDGDPSYTLHTPNIGFVCNPSSFSPIAWNDKKYPNLFPGCKINKDGWIDEADSAIKNLYKGKYAKQHFLSLLNYLTDQEKFVQMMSESGNTGTFNAGILAQAKSYVKKHGLHIYGYATVTDKETLEELINQKEVYSIYTEEMQ